MEGIFCSESFYKCALPEIVEECKNCLELNIKCAKALEEINSLNLAIKLLMDEMKSANFKKLNFSENGVRNNSDNKDDVGVPVRMESGWNEVSSRHSASSSGNIKVSHPVNLVRS